MSLGDTGEAPRTSVREHYDQLLGPVYSWMAGGVESALERGAGELDAIGAEPLRTGTAVDLGAGFGMHAIPLARRGFEVLAIDSCATLLGELQDRGGSLPIRAVRDDLRSFPRHLDRKADLVVCMGDTLTHLADRASVAELVASVSEKLVAGGRFVLTLRDYSVSPRGEKKFIPVRSDENRILTCMLEYGDSHVAVHDILHEREGSRWHLSVSEYAKLRISPDELTGTLQDHGFEVEQEAGASGMLRFVARRV